MKRRNRGPLWRRLSIFSPRLFSVTAPSGRSLPDKDDFLSKLLSPHLFSLSPNDGLFSLPDLFGLDKTIGTDRWMNGVLALSGAGSAIRKVLEELAEEKKRLEEQIFPMVVELEKKDRLWRDMLDDAQRRHMAEQG